MKEEITKELEKRCKNVYAGLATLIRWKWDDRFKLALAEFRHEYVEKVLAIISKEFETKWDSKTIGSAPKEVKDIANVLGGVRNDQVLFTAHLKSKVVLFCTWWPWNNKKNVSIRIGAKCTDEPILSEVELVLNIGTWFEI